ncbi:MAG: nitrous oxide-stimulated promoter family protein [bacterium]
MSRLQREQHTLSAMIGLYCRDHHGETTSSFDQVRGDGRAATGSDASLCSECGPLLAYAERRVARCRFGDQKPTCARCTVHCYAPVMRERIRVVMRYSGPRMTTRHPLLALAHLADRRRTPVERSADPVRKPAAFRDVLQDKALSSGAIPDPVLRRIVRSRVKGLVAGFDRLSPAEREDRGRAAIARLEASPIAVGTDDANRQHYDLPPDFFRLILGPRLKYSCCLWPAEVGGLAEAEEAMLSLTAERAGLADGQEILDLGCGWGSLAAWTAERHPGSKVVAMSNSREQGAFIRRLCDDRGLANVEVRTAEVGHFDPGRRFDRIVSVEMFEHARNHRELLRRISGWLHPDGRLFAHVFCHRDAIYEFDPDGVGGWMARHFFSGGTMPSWDYLARYEEHLTLLDRWQVDGDHYARTLRAWLENLDRNRHLVMPILREVYGSDRARLWMANWRVFFMASEEMFALDEGRQYLVGHYLFAPR